VPRKGPVEDTVEEVDVVAAVILLVYIEVDEQLRAGSPRAAFNAVQSQVLVRSSLDHLWTTDSVAASKLLEVEKL